MAFQFFRPDIAFNDIYLITPETLISMGIKGVVFDIDNTIAPYEVPSPTDKMKNYFNALLAAGIKMAFVSNNKGDRVGLFNEGLGFFYVCKAGKPSPKGICRCIEYFGLPKEQVLAVGDQIFTDCIAAHRAKIRFALVKPIKDKETLFFRIKRFFEKPFVKGLKWLTKKDKKVRFRRKKKRDGRFKILKIRKRTENKK
ncbi:MAG: YqeG family HAD IIIA-type phosphatase [Ruminococcaceae bacterium]|nr:YqeG family HAD IIIA-type phosphatase [Oscillospiraceae bacterium]